MTDSRGAKWMRGFVKTIFICCFAAFMYASIGHVAVFFQNYEQGGAGDVFGSYLVAGSIDITALVTTTGVMFFRKSMPRHILIILWAFIIGLALYSFLINWEYASHFQNASLLLQPTGKTTPVYDTHDVLHYVPVMQLNTTLLLVNPALASCFTIFALIYSVVGEFFGAKPPTAAELQAKKKYLNDTAGLLEEIRTLEEKGKGPSAIARATAAAKELKAAAKALTGNEETKDENAQGTDPDTDKLPVTSNEEDEIPSETYDQLTEEEKRVANRYPKAASWLTGSDTTVPLPTVSSTLEVTMKLLRNRVTSKDIRATRNKEIVFKDSVVTWVITELLPADNKQGNRKKASRVEPDSQQDTTQQATPQLGMVERAMLKALREASPEMQAELRQLATSQPLNELTRILQERYPDNAQYFTEERVANVIAVFQSEPELSAV
jgi:hypothetical protein